MSGEPAFPSMEQLLHFIVPHPVVLVVTHNSVDVTLGATRMLANPGGYNAAENRRYDPALPDREAHRMERPHYHGHRKRLRERFLKNGLAGFAEHEVVELLLTLAIPRADVKQPARALLGRFGSLRGVLDAPLSELRSVAGVGEVAAVALHIVRESATLYLQEASRFADLVSFLKENEVIADYNQVALLLHSVRDLRTLCRAEGVIGEIGDSEAPAA